MQIVHRAFKSTVNYVARRLREEGVLVLGPWGMRVIRRFKHTDEATAWLAGLSKKDGNDDICMVDVPNALSEPKGLSASRWATASSAAPPSTAEPKNLSSSIWAAASPVVPLGTMNSVDLTHKVNANSSHHWYIGADTSIFAQR